MELPTAVLLGVFVIKTFASDRDAELQIYTVNSNALILSVVKKVLQVIL